MSEVEFYRLVMAGMGSINLALIALIYRGSTSRLDRIDRRLAGFVQGVMHLMVMMHPDKGPEIIDTFKCFLTNGKI